VLAVGVYRPSAGATLEGLVGSRTHQRSQQERKAGMTKFLIALMMVTGAADMIDVSGRWQITQTTFDDDNGGRLIADCDFTQKAAD